MDKLKLNVDSVLRFKNSAKMLYASNGRGVRLYITLNGRYQVYIDNNLEFDTDDVNASVNFFEEMSVNPTHL